jgi:hypothetical protein
MRHSIRVISLFAVTILTIFALSFAPNGNTAQTRQPTKWALLVGIDKYRHTNKFSNLDGCVNDVENLKTLLTGKFGFPPAHVLVLTDSAATHDGIVAAFKKHLIANAQAGDIVVFHYSGHGSQMKDVSGDELDGLDETIVPHDSRDPAGKVFDISDDEINGLLQELSKKTKNITFIFDSCNSGTVARGANKRRTAPKDEREPPQPLPSETAGKRGVAEGRTDLRPENANYALVSACLSKQSASEHNAGGKDYGALTYFLVKELQAAGAGVTYRDVMDRVKGEVNAQYFDQLPQLEGARLDRYVFSDSSSVAEPYVLASPQRGTNLVSFEAGQVQGVTAGSVYEIYPPETKDFGEKVKPLAEITITKVMPFTAEGKLAPGQQIPPFSRAVERAHHYPDLKLRLYYQGLAASPALRAIKDSLAKYQYVETVPQAQGYHLLLRELDKKIVTEGADTSVVSPPVATSEEGAVDRVVQQITDWAKWFNLLSLDNSPPAAKISLTINAVRGGVTRDPFAHIDTVEAVLQEGEEFECIIENNSRRDLYVSLLDLSTDGSVAVIYPHPEGASELLKPGTRDTLRLFETFVPEDRDSVMDVIKLFATSQPVDFHLFTQAPVRGGQRGNLPPGLNDPLYKLLEQATLGVSRGARPAAVKMGDWATAERVFKVKR